jgi:hypothetical protein
VKDLVVVSVVLKHCSTVSDIEIMKSLITCTNLLCNSVGESHSEWKSGQPLLMDDCDGACADHQNLTRFCAVHNSLQIGAHGQLYEGL